MAITTDKVSSIQAVRLRAMRLTDAGAPDAGADSLLVTDALISVQVSEEVEAGAEVIQKNGSGAICLNYKAPDRLKRAGVSMNLCQLDSELLWLIAGGTLITDGGQAIGVDRPDGNADIPKVAGGVVGPYEGDAPSVSSDDDSVYVHWVFPKCQFTMGQFTIEEGVLVVPVTGSSSANPTFGDGPANADLPFYITGPYAWFLDENPLPAVTDGLGAVVGS
ncbi:MAG: hypothetical protein IPM45_18340 [Acidimicrobiales bacterium]|nr:hypothetical protein [Acidimicrobiales bacterium]